MNFLRRLSPAGVSTKPSKIWRIHSGIEHLSVQAVRDALAVQDEPADLNLCFDVESSTYSTLKSRTALGKLLQALVRKNHSVRPRSTLAASRTGDEERSETEPFLEDAVQERLTEEAEDFSAGDEICALLLQAGADPLTPIHPPLSSSFPSTAAVLAVSSPPALPANFLQAVTSRLLLPGELQGDVAFVDELASLFSRGLGPIRKRKPETPPAVSTSMLVAWCLSGRTNAISACLTHLKEVCKEDEGALEATINAAVRFPLGTFSPLTAAVFSQRADAVRLMLEQGGADPDLQPRAAVGLQEDGKEAGISAKSAPAQPEGSASFLGPPADAALIMAIQQQDEGVVRLLLFPTAMRKRADPNLARLDSIGAPPLLVACAAPLHNETTLAIVDLLLSAGADPSKGDSLGATPLMAAVQSNCLELVDVIAAALRRRTGFG